MTTSKPSVFVVGASTGITRMWYQKGYMIVTDPNKADIISFIGGADVNPRLYNHKAISKTNFYGPDDKRDVAAYERSLDRGQRDQLKVGICRGAQFLNVMNGGKMYQHVGNHAVPYHKIIDTLFKQPGYIEVTSTHHQMMKPHEDAEIIAYAEGQATEFWDQNGELEKKDYPPIDYEVLWYDQTRSLCFQPHPEFQLRRDNPTQCEDYFFKIVELMS